MKLSEEEIIRISRFPGISIIEIGKLLGHINFLNSEIEKLHNSVRATENLNDILLSQKTELKWRLNEIS